MKTRAAQIELVPVCLVLLRRLPVIVRRVPVIGRRVLVIVLRVPVPVPALSGLRVPRVRMALLAVAVIEEPTTRDTAVTSERPDAASPLLFDEQPNSNREHANTKPVRRNPTMPSPHRPSPQPNGEHSTTDRGHPATGGRMSS